MGLTMPGAIFNTSVTGSPVTTSGTLAPSLLAQSANTVFAGPTTGSPATSAFRFLVSADLPQGSSSQIGGLKCGTGVSCASGVASVNGLGMVASGATAVSLSGTVYMPIAGGGFTSGTESNVDVPAPGPATLSNFYVQMTAAPGAGNTAVFTVRDNAAGTALTCTVSGSATSCNDTTHTVNISQGDLMDIQVAPTGTVVATPNLLTSLQWPSNSTGGSVSFSSLTSGTNTTAAMLVGAGASLAPTSTGTISANQLNSVPFCTGFTPTNGQNLQYTTGGSPNPCYTAATASSSSTPRIVNYTYVTETSSTPVASITSPAITVTAGDTVAVNCGSRGTTLTSDHASDSASDSFTYLTPQLFTTNISEQMSWAVAAGGSTTFTCTPNTSAGYQSMIVVEIGGTLGTANTSAGGVGGEGSSYNLTGIATSQRTLDLQCVTTSSNTVQIPPGIPTTSAPGMLGKRVDYHDKFRLPVGELFRLDVRVHGPVLPSGNRHIVPGFQRFYLLRNHAACAELLNTGDRILFQKGRSWHI